MNRNALARQRHLAQFALLIATVFLSVPIVFGQSGPSGSLSGVVQDPNGASLPGVVVTVKNLATGATRTLNTNEEGRWTMPALPVGTYEVSYEMSGFKKLVRDRVDVEASVPRTLEDRMEVGEVGATINIVEGAALVTPETATTFR
ncbi:MAG TPA: carboxypeptidase-like regulatory domain-containing protein, partial [Pyrinomonadaceae bacterium]|nr:carboxypeptidase-like regulatory domain-containing protein [Pyrinomonadaceae bacterium]